MPRHCTSEIVRFFDRLIFLGKALLAIVISIYFAIIFIINYRRLSVPITVPIDFETSDNSPPAEFAGILIYLMLVYTLYEKTKANSSLGVDNPMAELIQHPCFSRSRIFGDSDSLDSGYSFESLMESIIVETNYSDDDYDYGYDADIDEDEDGDDVDAAVAIDIDDIVSSEEDSCCIGVDSYTSYTSNDDINNDNLRFSAYKPKIEENVKHNNTININSATNIINTNTINTATTNASSIATMTASNDDTSSQITNDVPYTFFLCGTNSIVFDQTISESFI